MDDAKKILSYFDYVFERLMGSGIDENGQRYSELYWYEINEFIDSFRSDMNSLLSVYGTCSSSDIEKIFALNFYYVTGEIKNVALIQEVAIDFERNFCSDLKE